MVHGVLNPEEMEAIRKKLAPQGLAPLSEPQPEPTPIPLIADDHAGSRAKPEALRILNGWLPHMLKLVRRAITVPLQVGVADASIVEGAALREELEGTWMRFARGPKRDALVLSFGGPIVEHVAARLLGSRNEEARPEEGPRRRSTSNIGRKLFSRVGDLALSSLTIHWQDQLGIGLIPVTVDGDITDLKRSFFASDVLVCAAVDFTAPAGGRLVVAGRPNAFLSRAPEVSFQTVSRRAVENALGTVPVEVSVELGRTSLTMREIATLAPGSFIELSSTVDTPLPIRCEGVLKAYGRPVVSEGAVAVEIILLEVTMTAEHESLANAPNPASISLENMLSDVPLQISVELGRITMSLREVADRLTPGAVVSLAKVAGEKLDVRINNHLVARGEAVAVGDRYGIRITDLVSSIDGRTK